MTFSIPSYGQPSISLPLCGYRFFCKSLFFGSIIRCRNPGPVFLHYHRVSLRFIIFQIISELIRCINDIVVAVLLLCLFFVSAVRHLYCLCVALNLLESKRQKGKALIPWCNALNLAEVKSPNSDLVCEGRFGPTIFSKSVPTLPSFGSCFSSPNLSINRETNQMLAECSRASLCPDKFSSPMRSFGDASSPNISVCKFSRRWNT